jgi:hypothetical protein
VEVARSIGCPGRRCSGRLAACAQPCWASRRPRRCWVSTRQGSAGPGRGRDGRWTLSDPWETGFVDLTGAHGLLGQVDGRTSGAVRGWLAQRSQARRDAVQLVAIDPCTPYAAAVRLLLPHARIAVDHFHLVLAANRAVTTMRQRVTRTYLGRRGRRRDPMWVNRRHLLRARERLSSMRFTQMERLHRPRPFRGSAGHLDRQRGTTCPTCLRRDRRPAHHPGAPVRLLHLVRRHRRAGGAHPRCPDRHLVAGRAHLPADRRHECRDRGHEQTDQIGKRRRARGVVT